MRHPLQRAAALLCLLLLVGLSPASADTFEKWASNAFTPSELTQSEVSGPDASPARDGMKNLLKYSLGLTTPKTSGRLSHPTTVTLPDGRLGLTFFIAASTSEPIDLTYVPEASGSFTQWLRGPTVFDLPDKQIVRDVAGNVLGAQYTFPLSVGSAAYLGSYLPGSVLLRLTVLKNSTLPAEWLSSFNVRNPDYLLPGADFDGDGRNTYEEFLDGTSPIAAEPAPGALTFAQWQARAFTLQELQDFGISGPNATPAQDGIPNLIKFAAGNFSPRVPSRSTSPIVTLLPNGTPIIRFTTRQWASPAIYPTDLAYVPEASADLMNWQRGPSIFHPPTATVSYTNGLVIETTYTFEFKGLASPLIQAVNPAHPAFLRLTLLAGQSLPSSWLLKYFGTIEVSSTADADGDGLSNYTEFLQGSDPRDFYNGLEPTIELFAGNNQYGLASSILPEPLIVWTGTANGPVRFQASGAAQLSGSAAFTQSASDIVVISDSNGKARAWIKLPAANGVSTTIQASPYLGPIATPHNFVQGTAFSQLPAPGNPAAWAGDAQVILSWQAVPGASTYTVKRTQTPGGPYSTVASGLTSLTLADNGRTNGITYYYTVEASSSIVLSGIPTPELAATPQPPGVPAAVIASAISTSQTLITWANEDQRVTSHMVERQDSFGGPWNVLTTTTGTVWSAVDADAGAFGRNYRVTARFGTSSSAPSQICTAATVPLGVEPLPVADIAYWLKPDGGVIVDGQGKVLVAGDASPSGLPAFAPNGQSRPTLISNALNGLPVYRFSGIGEFLTVAPGLASFPNGLTAFVVAKPGGPVSWQRFFDFGNGPASDNILLARQSTDDIIAYQVYGNFQSPAATHVFAPGYLTGTASIYTVNHGLTTARVYRNGELKGEAAANPISSATRTLNYIGKSNWNDPHYLGDIAEIILFSKSLSGSEQAAVQKYLNLKYACYGSSNPGGTPAIVAPSSLVASGISPSQIVLTWATTSTGPNFTFEVERRSASGTFQAVGTFSSALSWIDSSLSTASTYTYRLRVRQGSQVSSWSDEVTTSTTNLGSAMPLGGIRAWYSADAGTSPGPQGVWTDISGHNNHATQPETGRQPRLLTSSFNGRPAFRFDSVSGSYFQAPSNSIFVPNADFSVFVVGRPDGTQQSGAAIIDHGASGSSGFALSQSNGYLNGYAVTAGLPTLVPGGKSFLYAFTKTNTVQRVWLNGFSKSTFAAPSFSAGGPNPLAIGGAVNGQAGRYYSGEVAEVLVYDRALNSEERTAVEVYLTAKHRLPSSRPEVPAQFEAWSISQGQLSLNWQPSAQATSYSLERNAGSGYVRVAELPAGTTTYIDSGLASSATYTYRLRSNSLTASSTWTVELPATTNALPDSLPLSDLQLWLRADARLISEGDYVTQWENASTSASGLHVLRQEIVEFRPMWLPGDVESNFRPFVRFGGESHLRSESLDLFAGSNDYTIFMVARPATSQMANAVLMDYGLQGTAGFRIQQDGANLNKFDFSGGGSIQFSGSSLEISAARRVGTSITTYREGVPLNTVVGTSLNPAPPRVLTLGSEAVVQNFFTGDVAEVLVYKRALTSEEIGRVNWYLRTKYQTVAPAVAAGDCFTVALASDGSVWTWGRSPEAEGKLLAPKPIPQLPRAKAIAAGKDHILALSYDGRVFSWGKNLSGQLGTGDLLATSFPKPVVDVYGVPITGVVAISAGLEHSLALSRQGTVLSWGANNLGQLGSGALPLRNYAGAIPSLLASGIAAGANHSLALVQGRAFGWGSNANGALGVLVASSVINPVALDESLPTANYLSAGGDFTFLKTTQGYVLGWGRNESGQIGIGTLSSSVPYLRVVGLSTPTSGLVASLAPQGFALARSQSGQLQAWGNNSSGQLGMGNVTPTALPTSIPGLPPISGISAGFSHAVALTADGEIYAWGSNSHGQLGDGSMVNSSAPTRLETIKLRPSSTDTNGNNLPDNWEMAWFTNLEQSAAGDYDGDGRANIDELRYGTNPVVPNPLAHPVATHLANISSRAEVGEGDNRAIAGFIIQGNSPRKVLIRGMGPSLTEVSAQNRMMDPKLELRDSANHLPIDAADAVVIQPNDNWSTTPHADDIPTPLRPNFAQEAALLVTLHPGAYTAILDFAGNGSGVEPKVGLVEVYELNGTGGVINISTRAHVRTGEAVLIGGFVIEGSVSTEEIQVLVRGIGPSLPQSLIPNPLPDPKIQLFKVESVGGNLISNQIGFNDNWLESQQAEIAATGLSPGHERDSAILARLGPGSYTVVMQDTLGRPGVGLVEIYDIQNGQVPIGSGLTVNVLTGSSVPLEGAQLNVELAIRADQVVNYPAISEVRFYRIGSNALEQFAVRTSPPWSAQTSPLPAGANRIYAVVTTSGQGVSRRTEEAVVHVNPVPRAVVGARFVDGTPGAPVELATFVVPVDGQRGTQLEPTGLNESNYGTFRPWFMRIAKMNAYHITSNSGAISYRTAPFDNPLVAFGSEGTTARLFSGENYRFGIHGGNVSHLRIRAWSKERFLNSTVSNLAPDPGCVWEEPLPQPGSSGWNEFVNNGYVLTLPTRAGLETKVQFVGGPVPSDRWDTSQTTPLLVSHRSTNPAYYFAVDVKGKTQTTAAGPTYWMAVTDRNNPSTSGTYTRGYALNFDPPAPWRSTYIAGPQFNGQPMPSSYYGRSLEEILNTPPTYTYRFTPPASIPSAWTIAGNAPEVRIHSALEALVTRYEADPLALTNYVLNEIELTDAISYNQQGALEEASINQGGVSRGALATYTEGQGSPAEQCALLVYLLRRSGVPAAYVFPPHNGMKMLDRQMSNLLRMQLRNAIDGQGFSNVPQVIPVNYPWVVAYIASEGRWVHIFPWLKDTAVVEGRNIQDYLPAETRTGYNWLQKFISKDAALFPADRPGNTFASRYFPYIERTLQQGGSGLTLNDFGTQAYNRRNYYTRWQDLPKPWEVDFAAGDLEAFSSFREYDAHNANQGSIYDEIEIKAFGVTQPASGLGVETTRFTTGPLRAMDLHNRRLYFRQTPVGDTMKVDLVLAPFEAVAPNSWEDQEIFDFSGADELLNLQSKSTLVHLSAEESLGIEIQYRRHKAININTLDSGPPRFLDLRHQLLIADKRVVARGDLAALNFNFGRVSQAMLALHAEEFWANQEYIRLHPAAHRNPDVFQGGVAYLMGMSYYERVSSFAEQSAALHKVRMLSFTAHGLSKLSPDAQGNLVKPNVDMAFQRLAYLGNQTLRPDQGIPGPLALADWLYLMIGQVSTAEHEAIEMFYRKPDGGASTVKLLQVARASSTAPRDIELRKDNYESESQNVLYQGKTLRNWMGTVAWDAIVAGFNGDWGYYQRVLVTPGPMTVPVAAGGTAQQAYKGFGTLILNPDSQAAYISGNLNGGYSSFELPSATFSSNNFNLLTLGTTSSFGTGTLGYYLSYPSGAETPPPMVYYNPAFESSSVLTQQYSNPSNSLSNLSNYEAAAYSSEIGILLGGGTGLTYGQIQTGLYNWGGLAIVPSNDWNNFVQQVSEAQYNAAATFAADPVNVMSGAFYHDEVDLTLPGPFPLRVRRNYSSQNLAHGDFGYGWNIGFLPYLVLSQESGGTTNLIYASEMDGSVIAYRRQTPSGNTWTPQAADNPHMANIQGSAVGSLSNPFRSTITRSGSDPSSYTYTLKEGNGFVRIYKVRDFPVDGDQTFNRRRPYLDTWTDNHGNPNAVGSAASKGNTLTFEFNAEQGTVGHGHLKKVRASNGNYAGFVYDEYGRVVRVFSGDGRTIRYDYDSEGDLVRVTRPDASEVRYEYKYEYDSQLGRLASKHLLEREIKPDGRVLENTYDNTSSRRVISQRASMGANGSTNNGQLVQNAVFEYQTTLNPDKTISGTTTVRDAYGKSNVYKFTSSRLDSVEDPLNAKEQYFWYAAGDTSEHAYQRSLRRTIDKRNLVTDYWYYPNGNLEQKRITGDVNGDGTQVTIVFKYQYDPTTNSLTKVIDPHPDIPGAEGNYTEYFYAEAARPYLPTRIQKRAADGALISESTIVYEDLGQTAFGLIRETVSGGAKVTYENSAAGFILSETRDPGATAAEIGTTDPKVKRLLRHNLRGELVEERIVDQSGATVRFAGYAYDALGNRTWQERRDRDGKLLAWNYDYYNRNGQIEWSDGPRYNPEDYILRRYDAAGRIRESIQWRSEARQDGSGLQAPLDPDARYATTSYSHNYVGCLVRVIDARGNLTVMDYDDAGQMLQRRYYEGDVELGDANLLAKEEWRYEPGGKIANYLNPLGVRGVSNATSKGLTVNEYTSDGKLKAIYRPDGFATSYRYTYDGRLKRETITNGSYFEYEYVDSARRTVVRHKSAAGVVLAVEEKVADQRGNTIYRKDADGKEFTNDYDHLNRVKRTQGPPDTAQASRQVTRYTYDATGSVLVTTNALGEKTVAVTDDLGRKRSIDVFDIGNQTPSRHSEWLYSADHSTVTSIVGSGSSAIQSQSVTDTSGRPVLVRKGTQDRAAVSKYDNGGNLISLVDETGAQSSYIYDGLNRMRYEILPGGSGTEFNYDPAGNLIRRMMPGPYGLGGAIVSATGVVQEHRFYDEASRLVQEYQAVPTAADSLFVTNLYAYSYYPANSPWAGRLQKIEEGVAPLSRVSGSVVVSPALNDPAGANVPATQTFTYDERLRFSRVDGVKGTATQYRQVGYDALSRLNLVEEGGSALNTTRVERTFSAYGSITKERVEIDGQRHSELDQSWNGAGRRVTLHSVPNGAGVNAGRDTSFAHFADGALKSVAWGTRKTEFRYDSAGLLTTRTRGSKLEQVTSRDSVGRTTGTSTSVAAVSKFTESQDWSVRGQRQRYTTTRDGSIGAEDRGYRYNTRGQLVEETGVRLNTAQTGTLTLGFDFEIPLGIPGVNPNGIIPPGQGSNIRTSSIWNVGGNVAGSFVTSSPTLYSFLPAGTLGTDQYYRPNQETELLGGLQHRQVASQYDHLGRVNAKAYIHTDNTVRDQALLWSPLGRLVRFDDFDRATTVGTRWSAIYDGLGRRLLTANAPVTGGAAGAPTKTIKSVYDPEVEFLEIGVSVNGVQHWKQFGPDVGGRYGSAQGIGGLEASVQESNDVETTAVRDTFGNTVARVSAGVFTWNSAQVGEYGVLPGNSSPLLSAATTPVETEIWRGRRIDETGLYYLGARYYEPRSGRFISPDPLGRSASRSLYDYAGGDPVNGLDPDGRVVRGPATAAVGIGVGAFTLGFYVGAGLAYGAQNLTDAVFGTSFSENSSYAPHAANLRATAYGVANFVWNVGGTVGFVLAQVDPSVDPEAYRSQVDGFLSTLSNFSGGTQESLTFRIGYTATNLLAFGIGRGRGGVAAEAEGAFSWGLAGTEAAAESSFGWSFAGSGNTFSAASSAGPMIRIGYQAYVDAGITYGRGLAEQGLPWENYLDQTGRFGIRLPTTNFPVYDFFEPGSGTAMSAKTLDTLTSSRLANPNLIYNTLVGYLDAAADFTSRTRRGFTLDASMINQRQIQLAVPWATTTEQWGAINRAVEYGRNLGNPVDLHVTPTY